MKIQDYFFFFTLIFTFGKKSFQTPQYSSFRISNACVCGRSNDLAPRIVGGQEVKPNFYPWMVAIFNKEKMYCGGSLINDRYVLTAGHCLNWSKKEDLSVVFGLHDRVLMETQKRGGSLAEIEEIIVHEDFSSDYIHDTDDIGLIKLKNPVQFTFEVRPVCLPKYGNNYANKRALVAGWGKISQRGGISKLLRQANVTILTNEACRKIASVGIHISSSMLCAYEQQTDACQGDSGGPLTYETKSGKVEQIGVVSWGIGCATPGVPGIYTRITSYLEWIALHTIDGIYCKAT